MCDDFRARVLDIALPEMAPGWRNHLINLTYHDMALALEKLLGADDLTWPHFAKWTSLTVGFSIRPADPPQEPGAAPTRTKRAIHAVRRGPRKLGRAVATVPIPQGLRQRLLRIYLRTVKGVGARLFGRSMSLANRGIFFDVGGNLADFVETFRGWQGRTATTDAELRNLLDRAGQRPNPPGERWEPGCPELLAEGLRAYYEALDMLPGPVRSQCILHGTICLTEYEQQRVQAWLRLTLLSPHRMLVDWYRRFVGWGKCREPAKAGDLNALERLIARLVTRFFVAVRVPGEVVRVTRDLRTPVGEERFFAADLAPVAHPGLQESLARHDRGFADRADGTGTRVRNWADLEPRLLFINTWFWSRQRVPAMFLAPYSEEEELELRRRIEGLADPQPPPAYDATDPRGADVPAPWTDAALDALRGRGDDPVDQLLDGIYGLRRLRDDDVTSALRELREAPPAAIAAFKATADPPPAWVDPERFRAGQRVYDKWRFQINMGLLFASLPGTYAAERGVQVLSIASQLTKDPYRRVMETARYLEDVMTTDAISPGTTGFLESKNIRILHGLVRRMVVERTTTLGELATGEPGVTQINRFWNPDWGIPANQEDTLGTLLAFGVKAMEFLDVIGVRVNREEQDAYMHAWCCIGTQLGLDPALLASPTDPNRSLDFEEGQRLMRIIEHRNLRANWAGQWLAAALLEVLECMVITTSLPRAFVRIGATPGVPEMLAIPRSRIIEFGLTRVHGFLHATRGLWVVTKLYGLVARWLGKRLRRRIDEDPDALRAAFREVVDGEPTTP